MNPLLEELKEYLRVDGDDENRSLNTFLSSAQFILEDAGVKLPANYYHISTNGNDVFARHRLAIMLLATHFSENRIVYNSSGYKSGANELPYGLQTMILQLRWVNPDELSAQ